MRRGARALAVALVVLTAALPARAHVGSHGVVVRSNFYEPQELRVDVGETVTWTAGDAGHTVDAEDGRFRFPEQGTLDQGEAVSFTFTEDETVVYRCRVHQPAMSGVIVVGTGGPRPPPPPPPPSEVRAVPSERFPTIGRAVQDAPPGTRVDVAPGRYPEEITVARPGVTIRGVGDGPNDVVIDGDGTRNTGIQGLASGVRVENLTVRRFTFAGVFWLDADGYGARTVRATDNGSYGFRAVRSRRGVIADVEAAGSARAGISIAACQPCDTIVERAWAHDNWIGLTGSNAGSLVVRRSLVEDNATGVLLRTLPQEHGGPQRGAHVYGNVLRNNRRRDGPRPPDATQEPAAGSGVWVAGGSFDVVEANEIAGHEFGVVVTGPATADRIVGNVVSASARRDLAWDGLGANVCFEANRSPGGREPTSYPGDAQQIYRCRGPATIGLPFPLVTALALTWALR